MSTDKETRINGEIVLNSLRLIGADGEQLGIMSSRAALYKAEELNLDLVEISPNAEPPVCRIMDYGKFKYAESKRMHEQKLKQKQVKVKEIKLRPGTDTHDFNIKLNSAMKFLSEGDKVKVSVQFRGREITHKEFGMDIMTRMKEGIANAGFVEMEPKMEGRQIMMVIAPKK